MQVAKYTGLKTYSELFPDHQAAVEGAGDTNFTIGRCNAHDGAPLGLAVSAPQRALGLHVLPLSPPELQVALTRRHHNVLASVRSGCVLQAAGIAKHGRRCRYLLGIGRIVRKEAESQDFTFVGRRAQNLHALEPLVQAQGAVGVQADRGEDLARAVERKQRHSALVSSIDPAQDLHFLRVPDHDAGEAPCFSGGKNLTGWVATDAYHFVDVGAAQKLLLSRTLVVHNCQRRRIVHNRSVYTTTTTRNEM